MGGEKLDAQLEPIAQALILILVFIGIASIAFIIINKLAVRRKERLHSKLSTSRRSKSAWVDLSAGREGSHAEEITQRSSRRRKGRSSSDQVMLDILAKPKISKVGTSSPDESSSG